MNILKMWEYLLRAEAVVLAPKEGFTPSYHVPVVS